MAALKPRAATQGPSSAVRELKQATHTLLRGCCATSLTKKPTATPTTTATATTAIATGGGGGGREQQHEGAPR
ncbi:hypothetical protein ACSSS7_008292 [Eimeria intestinalis]